MNKTVIFLILLLSVVFLTGCTQEADSRADALVSHMEKTGVKMYGAFWCGHCEQQKKTLGESVKNIYIECDARGDDEQAELCIEKGIEGYPTFELSDGSFISGVHSIDELIEITGFES